MASFEFDFDVSTPYSEANTGSNEISKIITETYEQAWMEFYEWEFDYCTEELQGLGNGLNTSSKDIWSKVVEWDPETEWPGEDVSKQSRIQHVQKAELVRKSSSIQPGNSGEVVKAITTTVKFSGDFAPVPPYEFCKYLERSMPSWIDRETEDPGGSGRTLWLPFCPFTSRDEHMPRTRQQDLLSNCVLHWEETGVRDPDVGIIEIETIARLQEDLRLRRVLNLFHLVDEQRILPRPIYSDGEEIGILKRWKCREPLLPPYWRQASKMPTPTQENLMDDIALDWCSICIKYNCRLHLRSRSLSSSIQRNVASIPRRIPIIDTPCGPHCAILAEKITEYQWEVEDLNLLKVILVETSLADWDKPCNIAAMVGKPCYAVYGIMKKWKDQYATGKAPRPEERTRKQPKGPDKFHFERWQQHGPCAHEGPCIDCECAQCGGWCGPACRCSAQCRRRPGGCKCITGCQSSKECPCRSKERECQVGICMPCRPAESNTRCRNNAIQRSSYAKTEVRRSKFGWGLFATEVIRQEQLINTYTGELYSASTIGAREVISGHLKRNYNFQLSSEIDIDGACAGNESRLINDAKPDMRRINCVANKMWVDGDPHLAIVATRDIRPGEELFMNYGDTFWNAILRPM